MKRTSAFSWMLPLMLLVAMVAGCAGPAATVAPTNAPSATAAPTSAAVAAPTTSATTAAVTGAAPTPAAAAGKPALKVADKSFTLDQLKAMKQTKITANGTDYTGVAVIDLLQAAGVPTTSALIVVGSDGYSANVDGKVLTAQDILAIDTTGKLNAVLPSTAKGAWVKDTAEIKAQAGASAPQSTAAPAAAAAATAPAGGPISLTDAANHKVELSKLPQRIAVIGRGPYMGLHIVYMFPEAKTRLVGMEQRGSTVSDFLPFVDPDLKSKTILAAQPGPEMVAALKPDLVIMKGIKPDTYAAAFDKLNIPYMYVWFETPDYFYKDVTNIGMVLGNAKRAQEINDFYKTRIDRITKVAAGIAEQDKVRMLTIEYTDRGGKYDVSVPAKAWMQTIEAQLAGGNPVWLDAAGASDGWTVVSLEQVLAWNPDKIFVIPFSSTMSKLDVKKIMDGLKADPQWQALKAVQNGQLYLYGKDLYGWDNPEPRWILGAEWMASKMYPDKFKDLDMNQEVYTYFSQMYGLDKAAVDKNILPSLMMDIQ